jgi:3-oxoadipate enol-lactonase
LREGLGSLAAFQLARWFTPRFLEVKPEVGEEVLDIFRASEVEAYAATCRAMGAMDLRRAIERIAAPTTIVVGQQDYATPVAAAELMQSLIPNSTLHVIPECSHLSAVEKPEVVAAVLSESLLSRV